MKPVKACIGGTFDTLHEGHKKLMETAFSLADSVLIGLTGDGFALQRKGRQVKPFNERKKRLEGFLSSKGWKAEIVEISDEAGPAAYRLDLDVIVVSGETLPAAERINYLRRENGVPMLKIVVVPIQRDEQGRKISSRFLSSEGKK